MPVGGGDVGLNAWVENGDILFYIAKSGSFDENNSMLKLGRIRIRFIPNPFESGFTSFRQELNLREGCIEFEAVKSGTKVKARLWVDIFKPVIRFSASSGVPLDMEVTYESWRYEDHPVSRAERMQCLSFLGTDPSLIPLTTYKDVISNSPAAVVWYHRNRNNDLVTDKEIRQQHLEKVKNSISNPLRDLTFGGLLRGENMTLNRYCEGSYLGTPFRGWVIKSRVPTKDHNVTILLHSSNAASAELWKNELEKNLASIDEPETARKLNQNWWTDFWNRSRIIINSGAGEKDQGWRIGRNYQLFRFMLACNAYGEYPTKFNGGLFTFDPGQVTDKYKNLGPDFRQWGGGSFTAQNQRLVYWPMLRSGDFSFMPSQFSLYSRTLPVAELRTKEYWKHDGASYGEHLSNYGLPIGDIYHYGWGGGPVRQRSDSASTRRVKDPNGKEIKVLDYGYLNNDWVSDEYETALEFAFMVLEYQRYSGENISSYIPFIDACLKFYDKHYQYWSEKISGRKLDAKGKLRIYPSTSLETYKIAANPTPAIAALDAVTAALLALPADYGSPEQREYWLELRSRIPDIPYRIMKGKKVIAPAESWEFINNIELPQLYPLFPYGLIGIGKAGFQEALDTWYYGADSKDQYGYISWHQDAIFCARLGLWDEAKSLTVKKLENGPFRFPAFWGPGHDWVPDHNWGGSGIIALQEMLMQTPGNKIYLLPAWPPEWNVEFKLYAPRKTSVEVSSTGRKITRIRVEPKERNADVINMSNVSRKMVPNNPGKSGR